MLRYIQKKVLISIILLTGVISCQEIRVCVKKTKNGSIIETLDLERYVMGVLSKEMGPDWPEEALKAQAVVSRTFAVCMANENREKGIPYDIENSIFHQVYQGTDCEKIERAVKETEGEILTYNGSIVKVFFHSTCGGKTAKTSDVWGKDYPYISSVDDPYCHSSSYYSWSKKISGEEISRIFNIPVENIDIIEKDESGRIKSLRLKGKDGKIIYLTGHRFRMMVNEGKNVFFNSPDIIPSTNFYVRKEGNYFIFTGKGYGHGVGMCQWGARKMAEEGANYRQILKFYFPKMELAKIE